MFDAYSVTVVVYKRLNDISIWYTALRGLAAVSQLSLPARQLCSAKPVYVSMCLSMELKKYRREIDLTC